MMFLKACPKCRGDLLLRGDVYGSYVTCLQCGFMKDVENWQKHMAAETKSAVELETA